ncbi:hypothetical protein OIU76_006125 [Salix suchowensis]|nr:hypothetical protein OIU76_006125 [Salix suchowensis]
MIDEIFIFFLLLFFKLSTAFNQLQIMKSQYLNKVENTVALHSPLFKLKRWQWWLLVAINIFFLVAGQSAAVLLGRFYYDQGGNSKWMATVVQTAGFPILFIPLFLLPSDNDPLASSSSSPPIRTLALIYIVLGMIIAGGPSGVSRWKYFLGFLATLGASSIYSLLLSLMQLSFQKVLKKETFSVVLEMQIFTSIVATCVSVAGLFGSGEWKTLHGEMQSFGKGSVPYVLTLVWTAVTWQVCSVGVVGLIFVVSSLFSNVISTVALAVSPIAAVIVFHDKMNGVKIIAMLLAVWGFASFTYQNYIDDSKLRKAKTNVTETRNNSVC